MRTTWVMALDVGATHMTGALVSSKGEIRSPLEAATRGENGSVKERIMNMAEGLVEAAKTKRLKPAGIAVGVPGIVDAEKGVLVAAGNLPELFGVPLGPELEEEFELPALLENDVNAQTMGETVFGVARGVNNFVLFSIGTDLGGGIVINGRLLRGAHHIAAEFGHMTIELFGEPCVCGGQGCAREWVSGQGLADKARQSLSDDSEALKPVHGKRDKLTARHVFKAAAREDEESEKLIEEFSRRFGAVVANVMKVLDPEMIVMAGKVCRTEPRLISQVVKWTRHYYFPIPQLPDFRVSELTKETAVLGPAAAFFLERGIDASPEHHPYRQEHKED
ncbi:MAG: ROK family protein [bacterium]